MNNAENIAPTDLRDFLKARGWTLVEEALRHRQYALRNSAYARRELAFPMDIEAPDYAESVANVLEKLAALTGQRASTLRASAQDAKDDVLRLRIHAPGATESGLPLSFAAAIVRHTTNLLKAAACTVLRPRLHHPKLSLSEATQLADRVRFGHTQSGSFVLQVACPLHAVEAHSAPNTTFVREVTTSLHRALDRLTRAIEVDRLGALVEDLKRSDTPALSANLCDALAGMHDEVVGNSLDLGFEWSALLPVTDPALRQTVRLQRDYFARIDEVRRELRAIERPDEGPFIGTVERLEGEMTADGRRSGDVVVSLLLPDQDETVRARVTLSADDYAKADSAHMTNNAYVRVSGRLRPGRQPRHLTDITSFELLPAG